MGKKAYALFFVLLLLLAAACVSMLTVSGGAEYVAAMAGQSLYRLDVAKSRGAIYDCNLKPLVGGSRKQVAAVAPTIEAIGALEKATGGKYRDRLAEALRDGKPFLLELEAGTRVLTPDIPGVDIFSVPERYSDNQPAPHVIGYLDSLGSGVSGVELAMNDALESRRGEAAVLYQVDALGRVVAAEEREVTDTLENSRGGVALTIDQRIQALAEEAGASLDKGAVVITETPGCEIRALASFPSFSPTDLAAAAQREDGPLLNRAFCAYAPGSVFKLVPAAVALESGTQDRKIQCTGAVNAGGLLFHCYGGIPHGEVDLELALEKSCNCYFITAVRSLGGQGVLSMAYNLGLGAEEEFGRGLFSAAGTLPASRSLENVRALANFSFGQGEVTTTPVQLCAMINAIASGGVYSSPKLLLGTVSPEKELTVSHPVTETTREVMKASTAEALQEAMEKAVDSGTAKPGRPGNCIAGVKTGTAQTGQYENGKELLHFWYCGYVKSREADSAPRYCITVLCESTPDDQGVTAKVFRQLAEKLGELLEE